MIKEGSTVAIHYTLTVDGKVADSSRGGAPLEYVHGAGNIIIGLEKALAGLKPGDKKSVDIEAKDAYGEVNPDAKRKVPRDAIQGIDNIKVGDMVGASSGEHSFRAMVSAVSDKEVELDFNHPLAGKALHFDVEVVSVK